MQLPLILTVGIGARIERAREPQGRNRLVESLVPKQGLAGRTRAVVRRSLRIAEKLSFEKTALAEGLGGRGAREQTYDYDSRRSACNVNASSFTG